MSAQQKIVRVRRSYNQWVANQTLEDYALRFTAKSARRWSSARVANTAIGAISFLALEAIGGAITVNYGFTNATVAILVVGALILLTSLPIAYYASTYGVDIDLLTPRRGLWLHRLDHHVADLRVLHLYLLRDRGGDHVARARNVFRNSAIDRLHHQLAGGDPVGDARHHFHQPFSALDAAALDRSSSAPVWIYRFCRSAVFQGMDAVLRRRGGRLFVVQPDSVRGRGHRLFFADRADRRAGRLSPLSARAKQKEQFKLVALVSVGRTPAGSSRVR